MACISIEITELTVKFSQTSENVFAPSEMFYGASWFHCYIYPSAMALYFCFLLGILYNFSIV